MKAGFDVPKSREKILEELKIATGWKDIHFIDDSYVIRFTLKDIRSIKGLRSSELNETFFLDFPSFDELNLSFLVHWFEKDQMTQYWTKRRRLHRNHDKPAFVKKNERLVEGITVERKWWWWGLQHRLNGPAVETMRGYRCAYSDNMPYHYAESWDKLEWEWWESGTSKSYPSPHMAELFDGSTIKKRNTKQYDDCANESSFQALSMILEWDPPYGNKEFHDELIPYVVEIDGLSESYKDGKLLKRSIDKLKMDWCHKGNMLECTDNLMAFNDALVEKDFFTNFNLWKGPFYSRAGIEFMTLTEFQRTDAGKKEDE